MATVCPLRSIRGEFTPGRRTYTVTYKIETTSEILGPDSVRQLLGKTVGVDYYSYGLDVDFQAKLVRISVPRRAANDKMRSTWLVECDYEFDQTQRPEFQGVKVEPFFLAESEPIPRAKHVGVFRDISGDLQQLAIEGGQETYTIGKFYPIGNSAGVPILPAPERDKSIPAFRVTWHTTNGSFSYKPYINTFNQTAFALTGLSVNVLSQTQIDYRSRFARTFASKTLRLRDVQMPIVQFYGYDWYQVTLEFVEESQIIYELDRGFSARARAGDSDGKGGTYSEGDFPEGAVGQRDILDPEGNPISNPVLLNGRGSPLDSSLAREPRYLGWERYPVSEFADLPIGINE